MRLLIIFLFLGACGAVNLSTLAQLSRLSPLTANPDGFVAAIVLPAELDIPASGATLGFTWVSETETLGGNYALQRHGTFEGHSIALRPGQQVLFFDLAPEDAAAIRKTQQEIIARKDRGIDGRGSFSVFATPCANGTAAAPLISTYLRIEEGGAFLPLVQGFDIRQEMAEGQLFEVPRCG